PAGARRARVPSAHTPSKSDLRVSKCLVNGGWRAGRNASTRECADPAEEYARLCFPMRALIVTNMYPGERDPALGSFVRDQVEALRRIPGVEVELFAFSPGLRSYPRAGRALRRRHGDER